MGYVIAVDGPAGSGKGTVTKKLAKEINFTNLDTGAMYRCVTLLKQRQKVDLDEQDKIVKLLENINIEFKQNGEQDEVYLNGENVTEKIRTQQVTIEVSKVSSIKEVREKMTDIQRKMAKGNNVIMEGRDIGTCVFPDADIKIYLDATVEERAKRRYKENIEKGMNVTYEEILETVKSRDYADMTREISPLKKADDAITIDSTNMTIEQVVENIKKIVEQKIGGTK